MYRSDFVKIIERKDKEERHWNISLVNIIFYKYDRIMKVKQTWLPWIYFGIIVVCML